MFAASQNQEYNILRGAVVVLLVLAFALGYLLYQEYTKVTAGAQNDKSAVIANFPSANASEEDIVSHLTMVNEQAQRTQAITIDERCNPSPVVARLVAGETAHLYNNGSAEVTVHVDADHIYTVPAGGEAHMDVSFNGGTGVYQYSCNSVGVVGIIQVVAGN